MFQATVLRDVETEACTGCLAGLFGSKQEKRGSIQCLQCEARQAQQAHSPQQAPRLPPSYQAASPPNGTESEVNTPPAHSCHCVPVNFNFGKLRVENALLAWG